MILGWWKKKREITVEQLHRRQASGEKFLILDVRRAEKYHGPDGRIPGAVHVPFRELKHRGRELAAAAPGEVVVVCRTGITSLAGLACLRGLDRPVWSLKGGMRAWRSRGFGLIHDTSARPGLTPARKEC